MTDLERAYAEATEWNMATLAGLAMRKGASKREVERQMGICLRMLGVCNELASAAYAKHPRVKQLIAAGGGPKPNLGTALVQWVVSLRV